MKSVQLLYPQPSVMRHLRRFLRLKEYNVISIDENKGAIQAIRKRLFQRDLVLDLNVMKVDTSVTTLNFSVSLKDKSSKAPVNDSSEEEKLLNSLENSWL